MIKNETAQYCRSKALLQRQRVHAGVSPAHIALYKEKIKMENQGQKKNNGHGPGTGSKPGANVCPSTAGKGIIGTVKGDPLKQKIRTA